MYFISTHTLVRWLVYKELTALYSLKEHSSKVVSKDNIDLWT